MAKRPPERLSEFQRERVCVRGRLPKQGGADDQDLVVEAELLDFLLSLEPVLVLHLKYWRLVTCVSGFVPGTNTLFQGLPLRTTLTCTCRTPYIGGRPS